MKQKTLKTLNFLRLIDENGTLSLSNVAVMAILVKLVMQDSVDLAAAATLLTVISNYAFKSYHRPRRQDSTATVVESLTKTVREMNVSVEKLKMRAGFVE